MWFALFAVCSLCSLCQINSQGLSDNGVLLENETECFPLSIQLYEGEIITIRPNCSWLNGSHAIGDTFKVKIKDEKIAILLNSSFIDVGNSSYPQDDDVLVIKGVFLGRTEATFECSRCVESERTGRMRIAVIRRERIIDHLFVGMVTLLMMLAYVGMGCAVDLCAVKDVLKRPVAPAIGFLSQYIVMPLAAFAVVKCLGLTGGIALGFFASGCAPGGGASNMYTYLLGGDSSLSVTMTLISTVASLAMFPLWLHTLGRLVYDTHGSPLKVPFTNIFTSLAVMIVPLAVGALVKIKRPHWAERIQRIMRPFFAIIIILLITLGTWSNLYLLQLISPWLVLGACTLSYSGFLLGGLLALVFRFKWSRVVAVAIETGVQNTGLPILLLKFSLPQPDADLSVVSPVTVAMLMPVPLWVAIAVLEIRKKCKGSSSVRAKVSEAEAKVLNGVDMNGAHQVVHFVDLRDPTMGNDDDDKDFEKVNLDADTDLIIGGGGGGGGDPETCADRECRSLHAPAETGDTRLRNERF